VHKILSRIITSNKLSNWFLEGEDMPFELKLIGKFKRNFTKQRIHSESLYMFLILFYISFFGGGKLHFTTLNCTLDYTLHPTLFECTLCTLYYHNYHTLHPYVTFTVKLDKNNIA